ncbi:UNVERIFIED_CONTAM: hypothetical protein HHA_462500 [Hammondia hammondi]|eukprot:XP_008887120.1 hypothetical protein HHA_462500 [Hammondia hammondi]
MKEKDGERKRKKKEKKKEEKKEGEPIETGGDDKGGQGGRSETELPVEFDD